MASGMLPPIQISADMRSDMAVLVIRGDDPVVMVSRGLRPARRTRRPDWADLMWRSPLCGVRQDVAAIP